MKKILCIVFAVLMCYNMKAQTTLTEAVDFHSIDDYGTEVHLFDILDRGQHVFMYFFFSDASTSEIFDPCVSEAYHSMGENREDIYFVGIAPSDDSLTVARWKEKYNIDFPVIHWYTGGSNGWDICDDYGVVVFSTAILIAPDREILIDNIWPITSTQILIDAFAEYGIGQGDDIDEMMISELEIFPNPASSYVRIKSDCKKETAVNIFDMTARLVRTIRVHNINDAIIDISDLDKGVYFINIDGKVEKLVVR